MMFPFCLGVWQKFKNCFKFVKPSTFARGHQAFSNHVVLCHSATLRMWPLKSPRNGKNVCMKP